MFGGNLRDRTAFLTSAVARTIHHTTSEKLNKIRPAIAGRSAHHAGGRTFYSQPGLRAELQAGRFSVGTMGRKYSSAVGTCARLIEHFLTYTSQSSAPTIRPQTSAEREELSPR